MKVAAYQAPLLPGGSMAAIALIRSRVQWCEREGVSIFCCPEAVLALHEGPKFVVLRTKTQ